MQVISFMVITGSRLLCSIKTKELPQIPENTREPSENEMRRGLPEWFRVHEVPRNFGNRLDKYYFSMDGKKFRSIREVREWRKNIKFEYSGYTSDEAPCF